MQRRFWQRLADARFLVLCFVLAVEEDAWVVRVTKKILDWLISTRDEFYYHPLLWGL